MHASAMAAAPALVYFSAATFNVVEAARALRRAGTMAFVTMDAGPHVKVLSRGQDAAAIAAAMSEVAGVERVMVARPGTGATLVASTPRAAPLGRT
jgi:diphosphomevalonate decarboxylase